MRPQPIDPTATAVPSQDKQPATEKQAAPQRAAEPEEPDLVGEKVLPANKAPSDAPLRPIKGTPLYKLTDLRVGGTQLTVHYERVAGEEGGTGPTLVLRTPDGSEIATIGGFGPFQGKKKSGDYVVNVRRRGGLPKNLEVYLVHRDRRWEGEGFTPRFKVSNSAVAGEMGRPPQFAREWTAEEAAKLKNPPPAAPAVNAHKNVGEDTDFVGHTMGRLPPQRYADPDRRPVLGVLYRVGENEPDRGMKVKCLIHLTPAYDARQARYGQEALFAKAGYAVGGLNVKTRKIITAVQVVFMKQKPDGTLDPDDSYTSKWLGHPDEGEKEGKVSGNGRKVIGMHLKHFGAVYAVALVLE